MLDHPVVDVALTLVLLYSVLSLVASVVKEWVSTLLSLRAKNLRKGIGTLIGGDYAERLYGHPLVNTLAKGKKQPSYIGADTFASALVDLLAQDEDGNPVVAMEDEAAKLLDRLGDDSALKAPLRAMANVGAETVDDLRRQVAGWFDEGMNRVSGWYRRQTQLIIFAIGAFVAVSANASTVHVVQDVWRDDALRYAIAQEAVAVASGTVSADSVQVADAILQSFPLGWEGEDPFGLHDEVQNWGMWTWFSHLLGWLFTAAAVSLGAPFWFDLLSQVAKLRGTGKRPGRG
ncbi:hypothetical protein [Candidatus Palauibacter sp.]|uniref:hypothetical protein n=1 Tax=Candidatus Palauibacter sp. TaxID=3101350 RepID=UPI003B58F632